MTAFCAFTIGLFVLACVLLIVAAAAGGKDWEDGE